VRKFFALQLGNSSSSDNSDDSDNSPNADKAGNLLLAYLKAQVLITAGMLAGIGPLTELPEGAGVPVKLRRRPSCQDARGNTIVTAIDI
jgi:hypothetical protein